MFDSKKSQLFNTSKKVGIMTVGASLAPANAFLNAAAIKSAETLSGNGALKYDTTGMPFVDQFGALSKFKQPRNFLEISKDISELWGINPIDTLKFTLYARLITRTPKLIDGTIMSKVHRGTGLKHETIMRMLWIAVNHKETFKENLDLFIAAGSWKDIFKMLEYDLVYHGWNGRVLDWEAMYQLISIGLSSSSIDLVRKYLPSIKARSATKTVESQAKVIIAKWITTNLYGEGKTEEEKIENYRKYQKLKSSGKAHEWQQLISKGLINDINFNRIPGRALSLLVNSKFLENHKLVDKYEKFMASKPVLKYTGYVHELFKNINRYSSEKNYVANTINKQFLGLIETAKKGASTKTGMIVVRDTSSSMDSQAAGATMSSNAIGRAMALYFSYMLPDGYFSDAFLEFNDKSKLVKWNGSTPLDKFKNDRAEAYGSTNFQSIIDFFIEIKKRGVAESEFPTGIICISDGEFNRPENLNATNFQTAKHKLLQAGFSPEFVDNFMFVLWDIPNSFYSHKATNKFETFGDTKNVFYFSGYDPSILAFLTGVEGQNSVPKTASELFNAAMDQELLNMIEIVD